MKYMKNHKKIMLIVTENCNLRCTYCYEKNKNGKSMSIQTAKKIIDKAYDSFDGYETMVIELHGGEPFLRFDLIKEIDKYVIEKYSNIPVLFRAITNGTLIHGEVQKWLYERRDRYEIMLSLDGKERQHDENRKTTMGEGSFASIDIDFFKNTWGNCPVSMTINEKNIEHLAEGTIWIQELGFECCNAFEWAVDWDVEKNAEILKRELDKLVDYYSENINAKLCLLVKYHLQDFWKPITDDFRYCVEIDDPLECYDADGKYAPCHGFTAFTMGSEKKAKEFEKKKISDFVFTEENICKDCQLIRFCRICPAANHMLTGDMQKQSPEICLFNRLCIRAGIKINKNRVAKMGISEVYRKDIIEAADAVENYLNNMEQGY